MAKKKRRSRAEPPPQARSFILPVRALLAAGGLLAAIAIVTWVSYVADPPQERVELGFVAPDIDGPQNASSTPRLFRADVAVDVDMKPRLWPPWKTVRNLACAQPAEVVAVFSGTQEMWRNALFGEFSQVSRPERPDESAVGVGVTAPVDGFVIRAAEGNLGPVAPRSEARTTEGTWMGAQFDASTPPEPPTPPEGVFGASKPVDVRTGTMRSWENHLAHVVVKFEAPWTSFRSLGSCYVQLPRLIRTRAQFEALNFAAPETGRFGASGLPNVPTVSEGLTRLNTDGAVSADTSQPRPSASGGVEGLGEVNDATWSCRTSNGVQDLGIVNALGDPDTSSALYLGKSGLNESSEGLPAVVLPDKVFRALETSRSCQATAVINAPQVGWIPVVALLIVGAVVAPLGRALWKGFRRGPDTGSER